MHTFRKGWQGIEVIQSACCQCRCCGKGIVEGLLAAGTNVSIAPTSGWLWQLITD